MFKKYLLLLILILFCSFSLFAQDDNLTIKVVVAGPGNQLYFWWGHIALIIENSETEENFLYDYGVFNFNDDNFYKNFVMGRLLYKCSRSRPEGSIRSYIRNNRSVVIYTLDLHHEEKEIIKEFAEFNVLPENRYYYYHHFKDNCSTRIRDIIDLGLAGQLKEKTINEESRFTLRQHVRRHTYFSPATDWFLNFLMGQVIDTPITVWEDMFLPSEVGSQMENMIYTDKNGDRRNLVSSKEVVHTVKDRPPVLEKPRQQWVYEFIFSLLLAAIFYLFFYLQNKNLSGKFRWVSVTGKALAGISMSLCGLIFGFASLVLYFLSIFTNHDYTYQNFNMIFSTPLLLAAFPIGIMYAFVKKEKKLLKYNEVLRLIWLLCALGVFISMIIKLLPWFFQDNLTDQMLILPIALVFACNPVKLQETLKKYFPGTKK